MQRGSLRSVLDSAEQWQQYSPELRHQILCDIAEGMAHLHEQDVFHRDLKSHNVLLTDDRRAVLTDFGLSKTATSISGMTNTESSFRGATPAWTAPEVFGTSKTSPHFIAKSDVYSYGESLLQLIIAYNCVALVTYYTVRNVIDTVLTLLAHTLSCSYADCC
jgi:serine/threonine protein kinase